MSVRAVLRMGNPVLLERSGEIHDFNTRELNELIQDMKDTMTHLNGAGLAAPQIGELKRVVIFGFDSNERYPEVSAVPFTVLINPTIHSLDETMEEGIEGCLSVPGLSGSVPRYNNIRYQGFDPFGTAIDRVVTGFHARVVQHECDHLNGILYPSRIKDFTTFGFIE
ncbi:MAG: peptide deformylase [Proteobacteria bacterium]|nr:peptide deformylase [Pseudomonadota bacterium]MDA1012473.1 peptide deformylase [Pseudomonadota bacterium]